MNILLAGAWQWPWYEQACSDALGRLGHDVYRFSWAERFVGPRPGAVEPAPHSRLHQLQNKLLSGPIVRRINLDLVRHAQEQRPDLVFVYRGTHVFASTVRKIRSLLPQVVIVQYCNDDPFSPAAPHLLWRHLKKAIPFYDTNFVYRPPDIQTFAEHGARRVELLRSYYVPELDFPIDVRDEAFLSDIVFAGHFEPDLRVEALEQLVARGYGVKIFGGSWHLSEQHLASESPLRSMMPILPAGRDDYRRAICGSKIALNFLSKINRDTYTRRNFEIPAMGRFMLSEYTDDLASLFEPGKEAEYFSTVDEMLEKIGFYLAHEEEREAIARAGALRVVKAGHDVDSRMMQMLDYLDHPQLGRR